MFRSDYHILIQGAAKMLAFLCVKCVEVRNTSTFHGDNQVSDSKTWISPSRRVHVVHDAFQERPRVPRLFCLPVRVEGLQASQDPACKFLPFPQEGRDAALVRYLRALRHYRSSGSADMPFQGSSPARRSMLMLELMSGEFWGLIWSRGVHSGASRVMAFIVLPRRSRNVYPYRYRDVESNTVRNREFATRCDGFGDWHSRAAPDREGIRAVGRHESRLPDRTVQVTVSVHAQSPVIPRASSSSH